MHGHLTPTHPPTHARTHTHTYTRTLAHVHSNASAASLTAAFAIISFTTPMLGGWVADSYWGRYRSIVVFACIYVVGVAGGVVASWPGIQSTGAFGVVSISLSFYTSLQSVEMISFDLM